MNTNCETKQTLNQYISNLIKQSIEFNHRTIILLTGENSIKNAGVACNFMDKLGLKELLFCYVKDNKMRKTNAIKSRDKKKNARPGLTTSQLAEKYIQKRFLCSIRYCLYKDTQKILGKTYDVCVFNNYLDLTPSIIARGMETVRGGGLIIFLAPPMKILESTLACAYKMSAHNNRFLKRLTFKLVESKNCLCLDGNFELLNNKKSKIKKKRNVGQTNNSRLESLKDDLAFSGSFIAPLVKICATIDQVRCFQKLCFALRTYIFRDNHDERHQSCPVTAVLTASRGRGKSATLGLAICAALEGGIQNICITSPCPENISKVWDYIKLGLTDLGYNEGTDFQIITSNIGENIKVITEFKICRNRCVRYSPPINDEPMLCNLLCIDEAAALPSNMLYYYLTKYQGLMFISSTICGYESSGMILSRMIEENLKQTHLIATNENEFEILPNDVKGLLYDIKLEEPIRYSINDPIETLLNQTLCVDYKDVNCGEFDPTIDLSLCNLYKLNRNILFNSKKSSEHILQQIMTIYSSSNYKYSSDHLQNLSDCTCVELLILTNSSIDDDQPMILCVMEVMLQGQETKEYMKNRQYPFVTDCSCLLEKELAEPKFRQLSGWCINWIVTNPAYQNKGFGKKCLQLFMKSIRENNNYEASQKSTELFLQLDTLPYFKCNYVTVKTVLNERLLDFFRSADDFFVVRIDWERDEVTKDVTGIIIAKIHDTDVFQENWLALYARHQKEKESFIKQGPIRPISDSFLQALLNNKYDYYMEDEIKKLSSDHWLLYLHEF